MAKITLNTITSSFGSNSLFNTNFASIATDLNDKVLYRNNPTGEANQMENDLDMNSNDILNVQTVNTAGLVLNGTSVTATGVSSLPASAITNVASGNLIATDVQAALNELQTELDSTVTDTTSNDTQLARGINHGRNLIINGDFQFWQRGTSITGATTDLYLSDRWKSIASGSTYTVSQQTHTLGQTDVPGNPTFFQRFDVTVANADARVEHRVENVSTAASTEVILSFYAKSAGTIPTGFKTQLRQNFGTGGSPSTEVITASSNHTLTSSFQRFTFTTTLPTISGKTLGSNSNDYLSVAFINDVNETWEADISNVQLEFGDVATDFEVVKPADQLDRCKRYFERFETNGGTNPMFAAGFAELTTVARAIMHYTEKREIPTFTFSTASDFFVGQAGTDEVVTATSGTSIGIKSAQIQMSTAGALTAGQGITIGFNTASGAVDINAEL